MKCPECGFEHDAGRIAEDRFLCGVWGYLYLMNKTLPTKEQFEAMQREGLLPLRAIPHWATKGETYELTHGHYGYGVLHDWPAIAAKTLAANVAK